MRYRRTFIPATGRSNYIEGVSSVAQSFGIIGEGDGGGGGGKDFQPEIDDINSRLGHPGDSPEGSTAFSKIRDNDLRLYWQENCTIYASDTGSGEAQANKVSIEKLEEYFIRDDRHLQVFIEPYFESQISYNPISIDFYISDVSGKATLATFEYINDKLERHSLTIDAATGNIDSDVVRHLATQEILDELYYTADTIDNLIAGIPGGSGDERLNIVINRITNDLGVIDRTNEGKLARPINLVLKSPWKPEFADTSKYRICLLQYNRKKKQSMRWRCPMTSSKYDTDTGAVISQGTPCRIEWADSWAPITGYASPVFGSSGRKTLPQVVNCTLDNLASRFVRTNNKKMVIGLAVFKKNGPQEWTRCSNIAQILLFVNRKNEIDVRIMN